MERILLVEFEVMGKRRLTDGGPDPVPLGHLGHDLDLAVANAPLALGGQARGAHRRNHDALLGVRSRHARRVLLARAGAILEQVKRVVCVELVACDARCLVGQRRHNVQARGINVRVLGVCRCPVEGACAEPVQLHFVCPDVRVEPVKVVLIHETIL